MKKLGILSVIILIIFYIIILITPRNYETKYDLNNSNIIETFDKRTSIYKFIIKYEEKDYPIIYKAKYSIKRKLISKITVQKKDTATCIEASIRDDKHIICSNDKELLDYRLTNLEDNEDLSKPKTYKDITIYNENYNYLIWNYKGYVQLNENPNTIDIFKSEKYNNMNTYQTNNYLLIPDYDSPYYFKKLYLYNTTKSSLSEISFDYEISYNTLYLGEYKNKAYILDLKNNNEYEINLTKNKIRLLNEKDNNGLYLINNKLEKFPVKEMIKNPKPFPTNNVYKYELINNNLYQIIDNYKIKISSKNVKEIVSIIDNTVFYLEKDILYSYNYEEGERKLLKYKEWQFNYQNQIFIFNKIN